MEILLLLARPEALAVDYFADKLLLLCGQTTSGWNLTTLSMAQPTMIALVVRLQLVAMALALAVPPGFTMIKKVIFASLGCQMASGGRLLIFPEKLLATALDLET
jgi:hypothetical protein